MDTTTSPFRFQAIAAVPTHSSLPNSIPTEIHLPIEGINVHLRILAVRTEVLDRNSKMSVEELMIKYVDHWTLGAMEILRKIRLGNRLTDKEKAYYKDNFGLMIYRIALKCQREIEANLVASHEIIEERTPNIRDMTKPGVCGSCMIVHKERVYCPPRTAYGPRSLEFLKRSEAWKEKAQIMVIGHEGMLYLPPNQRDEVINMGDKQPKYYTPCFTGVPLEPAVEPKDGLYWSLKEKMDVAKNAHLYYIVEFYRCPQSMASDLDNLCGFMRVIKGLQKLYNNPIIVSVGPHIPKGTDTDIKYHHDKEMLTKNQQTAKLLGWALGVGVTCPIIQHMPPHLHGDYHRLPTWEDEPLFSSLGATREYYKRLGHWLIDLHRGMRLGTLTPQEQRALM